jgi:hypothetical protein
MDADQIALIQNFFAERQLYIDDESAVVRSVK